MKKLAFMAITALFALSSPASGQVEPFILKGEPPKEVLEKFYKKRVSVPKFRRVELIMPERLKKFPSPPDYKTLLKKYSPSKLQKTPKPSKLSDLEFELVPIETVSFLPFGDFYVKWAKFKGLKILILKKGNFTLESLHRLVGSRFVEKNGRRTYTVKVPIFIGQKASLTVKNQTLRLAFNPGTPIMNSGELFIVNSKVLTWDTKNNRYLPIGKLSKKIYYLYGAMPKRPYIITVRGGFLKLINSQVKGLGYRGFSSFGISLSQWELENKTFRSPLAHLFINLNRPMNSLNVYQFFELFTESEKPSGILVGNTIEDNFMGFYSNNAKNAVLLGNVFRRNYQYNIDPHDWSKNLLVGYNLIEKARKAHGVVFSRFVEGMVFENLCVGNHGAGIMMDRSSRAVITDNILLGNMLGGISLLESDGNIITRNYIMRNGAYGIFVRNSLNAQVVKNVIRRNLGSGAEISVINILYQSYRNLYKDPFHLASSAWIEKNSFEDNLKSAVKSILGGVGLYKNRFPTEPYLFSGDLGRYTDQILKYQNHRPVIVPGIGDPTPIGKKVPNYTRALLKIEREFLKRGNREALLPIGLIELLEARKSVEEKRLKKVSELQVKLASSGFQKLLKAANMGNKDAVLDVGLTAISLAQEGSPLYREGVTLLAEAALLGSNKAFYVLYLLPLFKGNQERPMVEEAFNKAQIRFRDGIILDPITWKVSEPSEETKKLLELRLRKFRKELALYGSPDKITQKVVARVARESTRKKINAIKKQLAEKNRRFHKYFKWEQEVMAKAGEEFLKENPELIRFVEKKKAITQVWKTKLQLTKESDFSHLKPEIEELLTKINAFRLKKIDVDGELERIRREYFEEEHL